MMETVAIVVGIWQLTRWIFALVDAIEAPSKKKTSPTSDNAREASDPRQ